MADKFYLIIFTIALLVGIGAFGFGTTVLSGQLSKVSSRLIFWLVVISVLLLASFPFLFSFLNTLRKERISETAPVKPMETKVAESLPDEELVEVIVPEMTEPAPSEEVLTE